MIIHGIPLLGGYVQVNYSKCAAMEREWYDYILNGYEDTAPEEVAQHLDWSEVEKSIQNISHVTFFNSFNGIDIYYCYGADHYLFCEAD